MTDQPLIVLVHGAWGSPEMWDWVIEALPPGTEVAVADLPTTNRPGTTVTDDAAHVAELAGDRPSILVGHSYGGAVITEAAASLPRAVHLVYVAACMPDAGESMFDWVMKRPASEATPMEMFDDGTSLLTFTEEDMPYDEATTARLLSVRLRRFSLAGVTTPVTGAGWTTVPSTYLLATADTMIHPDTQREMAARATTVVDLDAEHQVPLSHPEVVARLLVDLVDLLAR